MAKAKAVAAPATKTKTKAKAPAAKKPAPKTKTAPAAAPKKVKEVAPLKKTVALKKVAAIKKPAEKAKKTSTAKSSEKKVGLVGSCSVAVLSNNTDVRSPLPRPPPRRPQRRRQLSVRPQKRGQERRSVTDVLYAPAKTDGVLFLSFSADGGLALSSHLLFSMDGLVHTALLFRPRYLVHCYSPLLFGSSSMLYDYYTLSCLAVPFISYMYNASPRSADDVVLSMYTSDLLWYIISCDPQRLKSDA